MVEGLLGGVVCGGRGATCSITLGGRWIRGCLLANTSSRICKICFKKSTSRRTSPDTTPVPLTCGSEDAIVAIARLTGDWPCDSPQSKLNTKRINRRGRSRKRRCTNTKQSTRCRLMSRLMEVKGLGSDTPTRSMKAAVRSNFSRRAKDANLI